MTAVPTVVVPLDGSSKALAALPVARGLSHLIGATVALVHVSDETLSPDELLGRIKLSSADIRGLIIEQRTGSPADAIVNAAAEWHAALIVMCAPARSDGMYPLGSVPAEVLRKAPCPVVLVPVSRGRRPWTLRQLALPHDGTPTSAAAIPPAAELAARAGAELVVIHVAMPSASRPTEPGTLAVPRYVDQLHHELPLWKREFLERVRSASHAADMEKLRLVVAQGEISAAILEFAQRHASDLIALAWRGCLEPERAQTIRRVMRGACCPVIIFRVQS